jgi:hypothetical protein
VALQSIASLILRHPVPARVDASMGAPTCMCAQLWVSQAQVGCGEGLELIVVEGRVRFRPGSEHWNAALAA